MFQLRQLATYTYLYLKFRGKSGMKVFGRVHANLNCKTRCDHL